MSYIDDFIGHNAGTMTRDQIVTSLRAAGYDQREINGALRRSRSRPAEMVSGQPLTTSSGPPAGRSADPVQAYIRQNREQYPREAIRQQLIVAGHDPATIDAALGSSDAERHADTRRLEKGFGLSKPIQWAVGGLIFALYVFGDVLPPPIFAVLIGGIVLAGALIWLRRSGRI